LEALAGVNLSFKLIVAGKGGIGCYRSFAEVRGLKDKVKFLGLVKEVDYLYAASDLLVLPSIYEPFSNVCLEAMASGLPILTSRVNGVSEILNDTFPDFIIENPFNTEELTGKIMTLASPAERRIWCSKLPAFIQKFSFSHHLDEVLDLYKEVLRGKKCSP
jgi:UDP-glucose:(heptosyl)LPS alpha-1,3-glucosyltransferase